MPLPDKPSSLFSRDDNGLIKNFPYKFDELNRIDWRALIPAKYLYVNPDYETEIKVRQNVKNKWDVDVTKCEDKELLVTLAGLKYLARLRGVDAVKVHDLHVSPTEVTSVCSIRFSPNFENPEGLTVEAQASASLYSVSGKFQLYLAAFAQNRAFVRAAKDALGIEILGFEEVDFKASRAFEEAVKGGNNPLLDNARAASAPREEAKTQTIAGFDGNAVLSRRCAELDKAGSHSFDKIKAHALTVRGELESDPESWSDFSSIPRKDSFVLLGKINDAADKKAAKKTK
jgi:hypothetical protein